MSDVESAAPGKPMTEWQKRIRKEARLLAKTQGHDWKTLPVETRNEFKVAAREAMRARRAARQDPPVE